MPGMSMRWQFLQIDRLVVISLENKLIFFYCNAIDLSHIGTTVRLLIEHIEFTIALPISDAFLCRCFELFLNGIASEPCRSDDIVCIRYEAW